MARVITAKNINLAQLNQELGSFGLSLDKNDADNKIITTADESNVNQTQLEAAVNNHVAVDPVITIDEKLAFVGLSIDDLKQALGL